MAALDNLTWDVLMAKLVVCLYVFLILAIVLVSTGDGDMALGFLIAIAVSIIPGMSWVYYFKINEIKGENNGNDED